MPSSQCWEHLGELTEPIPCPDQMPVNVAKVENNLASLTNKVNQSVMLGRQTLRKINPWKKQSLMKSPSPSQSLSTAGPLREGRGKEMEAL